MPESGPVASPVKLDDTQAWEDRVADRVEEVVSEVRRRTYSPLRVAAAAVVYGLLIATMVAIAVALSALAVVRILTSYVFPGKVWAVYLIVGGIFCLAGLLLWSKRR